MEERIYIEGNGNNYIRNKEILVNVPEQCPLCESIMSPIVFPNAVISDTPIEKTWPGNFLVFQVAFITRCTKCKRLYTNVFEIYKDNYNNLNISKNVYHQTKMPNIDINFSENIQALSPMFIKTYTQAIQAEKLNLNELSGMGFRKALEFLTKDFAIKLTPDNTEKIEKMPLSQVINNELSNSLEDISILLKNATWLGNDETHYIKKFPDKDISDMKRYISAAIKLIDSKLEVIKLKEEMQQN